MSAPVPIGIAIVRHEGRYLVGIRGPDGPLPGKAEFPGGKCHPGETSAECAVRECLEETGLSVVAETRVEARQHTYAHATVALEFWLCRLSDPSARREEHQGFRWVAETDLVTLDFPEANAAVVRELTSRDSAN
jgi:mutator protein MutT